MRLTRPFRRVGGGFLDTTEVNYAKTIDELEIELLKDIMNSKRLFILLFENNDIGIPWEDLEDSSEIRKRIGEIQNNDSKDQAAAIYRSIFKNKTRLELLRLVKV